MDIGPAWIKGLRGSWTCVKTRVEDRGRVGINPPCLAGGLARGSARGPPPAATRAPQAALDARREGGYVRGYRARHALGNARVSSPGVRFSVEISPSFCGDTPHPTWLPCRSQSGARISWRLYSACFCGVAPRSELSAVSFRQSAFGSQRCRITQCEGERKRLEEDRERGTVDQDLWWR